MDKIYFSKENQLKGSRKGIESLISSKEKRIQEYNKNPKLCENCNKPILGYNKRKYKYCSHSCAAKKNNKIIDRSKSNYVYGKYAKKKCLNCGKITKNQKCCNKKCYEEYSWRIIKENIEKCQAICFENGNIYTGTNPHLAKKYLKEEKGIRCEICGRTEWQGKEIPLVLDHINGKPNDWRLENIRLVCGNCNMQLPTFAGKNVGKGGGRPYRTKRYYEGKSW